MRESVTVPSLLGVNAFERAVERRRHGSSSQPHVERSRDEEREEEEEEISEPEMKTVDL